MGLADDLIATLDDSEPEAGDQPYTDLGNARRLVAAHGADLRYAPQYGAWMAWDGHRWVEDVTGEVHRRAKSVVDAMVTQLATVAHSKRKALFSHWQRSQGAARLAAMVNVAATEPKVPVLVSDLDADPWALNTLSGLIDLRTGEVHGSDRRSLVTKLAPVTFDASATCPTWEWFLHWAMKGDQGLVDYLQRSVGYSLTGRVDEQVMQVNHGTGANGKSTFVRVVSTLLGDYATQVDPELLMASHHEQHPTGLTVLIGRRVAFATETEQGRKLAEAMVKQLTGGDRITARRMRQDFFEFDPTHKLWMSTNHRPVVRGTDHAIWRRIRLIPWEAQVAPEERDEHLVDKLIAELPGILNWALEGCRRWREVGLEPPSSIVAATAEYRSEQDHLGRFLEDCCLLGPGWMVTAAKFRERYEAWCKENGEQPWSARAIAPHLVERGCERTKDSHTNRASWTGVTIADEPSSTTPPLSGSDDEPF